MFNTSQDPTLAAPPGPRKPRRLPGIQASRYVDDTQVSQLLSKYGDLTGGGLVAPVIAQSSELMRTAIAARGRGGARVGSRRDDVEYMPRREHELQMAQMDERIRQLSEEMRRREAAHEELAAQVRALMARNGVHSANDDLLGYSPGRRQRPLAGQHPLAEHPVDAMRSLQPPMIPDFNGDLGQNAPEIDPSQSTGGLPPIVPMLPLPPALNATGQSLGSHFGGGPPLSDDGASDNGGGLYGDGHGGPGLGDDPDGMFGLGLLEGLGHAPDVEPPERTIGEAGLLRLTAADGFRQVVHLELQYSAPVVVATPVPANTSDLGPSPAPSPAPDGDTDGATLEVAVVRKTATSFTMVLLPRAGPRPTQVMVAYVVLEAGAHLLSSGATLIAGESSLSPVEPLTMQFESSFVRCPALLTTLAGNAPRVRPRCLEVDSTRFGLGLEVLPFGADRLDSEAAAEASNGGGGGGGGGGGTGGGAAGTDPAAKGDAAQLAVAPSPSASLSSPLPPPISSEAAQEAAEAAEAAAAYSPGAAAEEEQPAEADADADADAGAVGEAEGEGDAAALAAHETDPAQAAAPSVAAAAAEGGEEAAASVPPSPPPSPPAGSGASEPDTPPPDDGGVGDDGDGEALGVNDDVAVAWLACDCEGGDGVLSGVLDISPGAAADVSFGIDYHELPVFLCALMGPLGPVGTDAPPPPLRCERLHERGATLLFGDADGPAEPVEQAGWLALQQGKLWALEAYDHQMMDGGAGLDDDGGRIGIHPM